MASTITYLLALVTKVLILADFTEGEIPGEECVGWSREGGPIFCYECTSTSLTIDNHCDDPFNASDPRVNRSVCDGYCVKWFRSPSEGMMEYQRTCSDSLKINMIINEVCVEESRPRHGHMCFCSENKCNAGNSNFSDLLRTTNVMVTLWTLLLMYFVIIQ